MEKIWLKHYDRGMPHTLQPYPQRMLVDEVGDAARQRPEHPALIFMGANLSYGQLEWLSNAFAAALVDLGVEKGERVALLMPNCPQFVIAQLGAWKAGAIAVPLNPLYTEGELSCMLADSGAKTVIVLTLFYDKLKAVQPQTSLKHVIATNIKEYIPTHLRLLFTALKEKKEGHRIILHKGDHRLGDLMRKHAGSARPDVAIDPQDPAIFLYSGGTTGTPKAAVGSHQALFIAATQVKTWFGELLVDWEDAAMGHLPLFHIYGNIGIMGAALLGRHPLALVADARNMDDLIATIQKVRPALLPGVPTLYIALLRHPKVQAGQVDFKSIKLCFSGASALMAETKNRFEALTGGRIVEGYALTESMLAAAVTPVFGTYKPGSVGMPLPDVEMRIVNADTGSEVLPTGEVGEIVIRAPQLMLGYWHRPDETATTIRPDPVSGERWLFTGDLGYLDEDGYLFIVDRKKDLIKPSGFQVWPREVEEAIASHPAVAEVGVAGIPDRLRGEAVKAWVVLREGQQISGAELRSYCRERLAAYKVPKHVEFRDSLPKTHIGKILRRELAREHVSGRTSSPASQPQVTGAVPRRSPTVSPVPEALPA